MLRFLGNVFSGPDELSEKTCEEFPSLISTIAKFLNSNHRHVVKETLWLLSNMSGLFIFVVRRTVFCLEREGVVVLGIFWCYFFYFSCLVEYTSLTGFWDPNRSTCQLPVFVRILEFLAPFDFDSTFFRVFHNLNGWYCHTIIICTATVCCIWDNFTCFITTKQFFFVFSWSQSLWSNRWVWCDLQTRLTSGSVFWDQAWGSVLPLSHCRSSAEAVGWGYAQRRGPQKLHTPSQVSWWWSYSHCPGIPRGHVQNAGKYVGDHWGHIPVLYWYFNTFQPLASSL